MAVEKDDEDKSRTAAGREFQAAGPQTMFSGYHNHTARGCRFYIVIETYYFLRELALTLTLLVLAMSEITPN